MDLAVQGLILLYFSTQSWFCPDKKPADKFHLPPSYQVLSELPDITSAVLDSKVSGNIDDFDVADMIFPIQLCLAILSYDSQSVSEECMRRAHLIHCETIIGLGRPTIAAH